MRVLIPIIAAASVLMACDSAPAKDGDADGGFTSTPDAGLTPGTDAGNTDPDAGTDPDGGTMVTEKTWYRDVLPIVQTSCQGCHLAGGIAPFALQDYATAFSRHLSIADAVSSRRMPPWMPDDACVDLQEKRSLTQAQIDTIVAWSEQGAPAGDPADAPPEPEPRAGLEWVDATLGPSESYTPNANASDDYRCFILPGALAADQDIIGFDIVPGTPSQVHHVILFAAPEAEAQAKDDGEAGQGWTCYGGPGLSATSVRMVGGWAPGTTATRYPTDTGVRIKAGNVIVMQVHYNLAQGAPQPDLTEVKLQYAKSPVPQPAMIFPMSIGNFSIPPQSTGYTVSDVFRLGDFIPSFIVPSVKVYGVIPHMHELGRKISVRNVTADACLIDVPKWDFHWQSSYQYVTPKTLLSMDEVELSCTWDNPGPSTVTSGEGTADEMCVNFFYVTGIPASFL